MTALIYKVLSNTATEEEKLRLEKWIGQSAENREEFENIKLLCCTTNASAFGQQASLDDGFEKVRQKVRMKIRAKRRRRFLLFTGLALLASALYIYVSIATHLSDKLVFEDQPLVAVVKSVEQNYGITITIEDEGLLQCSFTATFYEVGAPSNLVSSIASAIGARYEVVGDKRYRITGGRCE